MINLHNLPHFKDNYYDFKFIGMKIRYNYNYHLFITPYIIYVDCFNWLHRKFNVRTFYINLIVDQNVVKTCFYNQQYTAHTHNYF